LGEADAVLKQWLRNKSRFADLFNAVIFDGRQVIKPEELEEINSESNVIIQNNAKYDDVTTGGRSTSSSCSKL